MAKVRIVPLAALFALAVLMAVPASPARAQARRDAVTMAMDWIISGYHAPFFVALAKGYYEREGIAAEVKRGFGSADGIKRVAVGTATFVFGDLGTMVRLRSEGLPVKMVASGFVQAPGEVVMRKDSALRTPKDLEGKRIVMQVGGPLDFQLRAVFEKAGANYATVKKITLDPALWPGALIEKKVDAVTGFVSDESIIVEAKGVPVHVIRFAEHGVDVYGNGIIASDKLIRENPDLIRRFLRAVHLGYRDALASPEAAMDILLRYAPELAKDREIHLRGLRRGLEISVDDTVRQHGFGYMVPARVKNTVELARAMFNLKTPVPVEEVYTTALLPGTKP